MDPTNKLLELGLNGASLRHKAIANNIANVNTPEYKRKDVDFSKVLNNNINLAKNSSIKLKTTNKNHHNSFTKTNNISFKIANDSNTEYRNDGNNVDIDTEMANMAKNNLYYNTLSKLLSQRFSLLKNVIEKGGK